MGSNSSALLQQDEIMSISEETGFTPATVEKLYSRFIALDKGGNGSLSRQDCLAIPELAINPLCDRIVQMFFSDCDEDHERINFRQFMKVLATFRPISSHNNHHNHHHSSTNQHSYYYASNNHHKDHQSPIQHSMSHNNLLMHGITNNLTSHHQHNNHHNHNGMNRSSSNSLLDPEEPINSKKQKLYFIFKLYDVDNDDRISLDDVKSILKTMVGNYISEEKLNDLAVKTVNKADKNGTGFIEFEEFCSQFCCPDILTIRFANK